jgi:hypothetical protein
MTNYSNGFEVTAAVGEAVTLSNLATGGSSFQVGPPNLTTMLYTADAAHGSKAIEINAPGIECHIAQDIDSASALKMSVYVKVSALPGIDVNLWRMSVGNDATALSIRITAAGKLGMYLAGGTLVWVATENFPTGAYHRIDAYIDLGSGAGQGRARLAYYALDSVTAIADSGLLTGVNTQIAGAGSLVTRGRIGKLSAASGYSGSIKVDDYRVVSNPGDTALLGPVAAGPAAAARPSAVSANPGGFVDVGGSGGLVPALSDALDSTYAESPDNPSGASLTADFPLMQSGPVTVSTRNSASLASPTISRKIDLLQGATVIATRTITLTTAPTDHSFTTTTAETAAITSRGDLHVRVTDTAAV